MFQVKDHSFAAFEDERGGKHNGITVRVQEVISGDYGLYVWPSAIVMAEYVWKSQSMLLDKVILEMGAGTGLPSLVAASFSTKRVFTTDYAAAKQTLDNLKHNCELNGHLFKSSIPEVFGLTWGDFSLKVLTIEPPDVILGADCFYDNSSEFDNILATVTYYLTKKPNSYFLTTYQVRSANRSIAFLLDKWRLEARTIALSSFMDADKLSELSQEIELVQITLKKEINST